MPKTQRSEQMSELDVAVQTTPCYFAMQFEHLIHEYDIHFYTGFESPEMFSAVFDFVKFEASIMTCLLYTSPSPRDRG